MSEAPVSQARYQIRVYDSSGVLQGILDPETTIRDFQLERRVNQVDILTIHTWDDPEITGLFSLDGFIEVWRKVDKAGTDWYIESTCFNRTPQHQLTEGQSAIYTAYGRGLLDLIRRREILYFATTAQTLKSGPGETVIKQFVEENAGPSAVFPRIADGAQLGLTVEPDAGQGVIWSGQRSWQNLLTVIQEIASLTNVDFDIIKTGAQTFEFRCYYPQRGTDRSTTVRFSPTLGNMLNPSYTLSRTEEVTRVAVLGQGQDESRRVVIRESADAADSPWNTIELTLDARRESTLAGLNAAGDEQLLKTSKKESFEFGVLQTSTLQYGHDYFLGDIINASFGIVSTNSKITGALINLNDGRETINLEFSTVQ